MAGAMNTSRDFWVTYPPVRDDSIIFEACPPPVDYYLSEAFPRVFTFPDITAWGEKWEAWKQIEEDVHGGDHMCIDLYVELTWQLKVHDMICNYPELMLTRSEIDQCYAFATNYTDSDGLLLVGKQGGKGPRRSDQMRRVKPTDKRGSLYSKHINIISDGHPYKIEAHLFRIYKLYHRQYPRNKGQHVSHYCEFWACMLHIQWEDDWQNIKVRRCHDKCKCFKAGFGKGKVCNCQCSCGMSPPCMFPPPHQGVLEVEYNPTPLKCREGGQVDPQVNTGIVNPEEIGLPQQGFIYNDETWESYMRRTNMARTENDRV
jgi:hypothetical protein